MAKAYAFKIDQVYMNGTPLPQIDFTVIYFGEDVDGGYVKSTPCVEIPFNASPSDIKSAIIAMIQNVPTPNGDDLGFTVDDNGIILFGDFVAAG